MTSGRLFDRAIIRITPQDSEEDAAAFLQGLVTNDVAGNLPVWTGLLSAQGKTLFDFFVWQGGDDSLLIDCEEAAADDLAKRLTLYRLRRKLTIERDDSLGVFWSAKPDDRAIPDPRLPELGFRWVAELAGEDNDVSEPYRQHRLSCGVAEGQAEIGDILWLEANAAELNGVSFSKGCYIGQENTARMNWRQKVNRRIIVVPLSSSDEKRQKLAYPSLDLAVDHLRVDAIPPQVVPDWLQPEEPASN
ncbi:folate-binding protein YgfZ [Altererythrobacter sp. SALINAS58]|uniref:CAF17-like 4Fe-4S cluster assembly/insertion protein YgfZ n=1 Tax=Alteripontixanthobacter muriae TaxID=2705546 RepID=UPI0015753DAC|nr:folate-binding protein YgfZ [Alteripontixanthobacter muriae]NTZ42489.1 folate-binding protein YgfZ [Alteripontixanthobacter muriae]